MPILHSTNEDHRIILSTFTGTITDDLLLQSYKKIFGTAIWQSGYHVVTDLREGNFEAVTIEGLREVFLTNKEMSNGKKVVTRTAIIATQEIPYALARAYEFISEELPENIKVVKNMSEAIEWVCDSELSLSKT